MDLLLLDFYYNEDCDVGSHNMNTMKILYVRHEITLYLSLLLYSGRTMDSFNLKKCSQSQQKKNIGSVLTDDFYSSVVDGFWAEQTNKNLQRHCVCIQVGVTLIFGLHPNIH
jgi:hypothetical protein